jgi:hypothetical protein
LINVAGPPRASTIAALDDDTVERLDEKAKENRIRTGANKKLHLGRWGKLKNGLESVFFFFNAAQ